MREKEKRKRKRKGKRKREKGKGKKGKKGKEREKKHNYHVNLITLKMLMAFNNYIRILFYKDLLYSCVFGSTISMKMTC